MGRGGSASSSGGGGGDDARVLEWEIGLPGDDDLTPLSHPLVPPNLASAFSISPVTPRTMLDVDLASQTTVSSLRSPLTPSFAPFDDEPDHHRRPPPPADDADVDPSSARTLKRPRLVWTPQLHKRFVDVVAHLGIESAVPKTIMQLMNVEGLSRENVASHLQKYRLYLKRMQGLSNEEPSSSSDHLFASTPVPQSLREPVPVPMQYAMPTMMPMHMYGMQQQ